jgi:hypothetical protein
MNFYQAAPDTIKALSALETQIQSTGLEQSLIELKRFPADLNRWDSQRVKDRRILVH